VSHGAGPAGGGAVVRESQNERQAGRWCKQPFLSGRVQWQWQAEAGRQAVVAVSAGRQVCSAGATAGAEVVRSQVPFPGRVGRNGE